jgi:hypothetical protein
MMYSLLWRNMVNRGRCSLDDLLPGERSSDPTTPQILISHWALAHRLPLVGCDLPPSTYTLDQFPALCSFTLQRFIPPTQH